MPDNDNTTPPEEVKNPDNVLADTSLNAVEAESSPVIEEVVPEVTPVTQSLSASDSSGDNKKKSKRGLIIALIAAGISVLGVGIGGYAAYAWHTSPEQVVLDGMSGMMNAKTTTSHGTFELTATNSADHKTDRLTFSSIFDTQTDRAKGTTITTSNKANYNGKKTDFKAAIVTPLKGTIYFKVDGVYDVYKDLLSDTLIENAMNNLDKEEATMSPAQKQMARQFMQAMIDQMIAQPLKKFDGQWVSVSDKDIKTLDDSASDKEMTCSQDALKALMSDKKSMDEIRALYDKHSFMTIKNTGKTRDDSTAYETSLDQAKFDTFVKEVVKLPKVKAIDACAKKDTSKKESAVDSKAEKAKTTVKMTVWAKPWQHQITGIDAEITTKSEHATAVVKVNSTYTLNRPVTIKEPTDAQSLKTLLDGMGEDYKSMFSTSFPTSV